MDILVTGYKPFLGESLNPSEMLANETKNLDSVRTLVLPVEFKKSFEILKTELVKKTPDFLLMIGQASGRKNVCFEKIGLNWVQTFHKDESGQQPATGALVTSAPLAQMSTFPIDAICAELKKQNFPVEISFSAGAYVCNDLYFRILNEFTDLKSVFIHVPLIGEQRKENEDRPTLEFNTQREIILQTIDLLIKGI